MIKQFFTTVVKVLISCCLLYLLIERIGLDKILLQAQDVDPWWCASAVLALIISNFLGSLQWQILLKTRGIHIPLVKTCAYYFVGLFFNNFLIGYIGGDAMRIFDVSRASGNSSGSVSTVFFDRFIGLLTMITMALISSIVWAKTLGSGQIIITVVVMFILWLAVLMILFNKSLAKFFTRNLLGMISTPIRQKGSEIYNGIHAFRYEKSMLIKIAFLSVFIQLLRILVHYLTARSVGIQKPFIYFLIFIPVVALISSLPISIGGIGVREQSAVILFSRIGVAHAGIVLFQLLAYLAGIIASIAGGFIFVFRKERPQHSKLPLSESFGTNS